MCVQEIDSILRVVATGGVEGRSVGVSHTPLVPNNDSARTNIRECLFYKFVALKELYSLQEIQLKSKYK